ncbi:MAG: hypothetical protein AB1806_00435 [Acidobacteriota bacterium]
MQPNSTVWPLLFSFRGPVMGQGFLAVVELRGRLLARQTEDGIILDGVNPGGFSCQAPTLDLANLDLRGTLLEILADVAFEAPTFDAFRQEVTRFFEETDAESVDEWQAAVDALRAARLAEPPEPLPRWPAELALEVRVIEKDLAGVAPTDNAGRPTLAAAA